MVVCRNYSTVCSERFPDAYFDFVYLDARHDYKGVAADIAAYWPKVRPGGVFAGHDYVDPAWVKSVTGQDWLVNYDGTVDESGRALKGAVDDFAARVHLPLWVTKERWASWMVRKPRDREGLAVDKG